MIIRFLKYLAFEFLYILRPIIRLVLGLCSGGLIIAGIVMGILNLIEKNPIAIMFFLLIPLGLIFSVCALRYDALLLKLSPDDMDIYLPF